MKKITFLILLSVFLLNGCKKKAEEPVVTVPVISTSAISNITSVKASCGGSISSNGGSAITGSGVCWSKTSNTPTLSDNQVAATAASGSFSIELTGLEANTTYYVRAYATNAIGTAYGEAISFSTAPNLGPVASAPSISGNAKTDATLTLTYVYADPENDPEGATAFQWYRANTAAGAGEIAIPGATAKTYVVQESDLGKYVRAGVTPKATKGLTLGTEVKSAFTSLISVGTDITFMYNGKLVTYGIIVSQTTGKKWLDRNLGAPARPADFYDVPNYGDLFQWGRAADGHQVTSWPWEQGGVGESVNGTTSLVAPYGYSNYDDPGHSKFIIVQIDAQNLGPMDWRRPQNNELWQLPTNQNNPCPAGWHVPTTDEFVAEGFTSIYDASDKMNFTSTGTRKADGYMVQGDEDNSPYWTSTIANDALNQPIRAAAYVFKGNNANGIRSTLRASGFPVRCIKN